LFPRNWRRLEHAAHGQIVDEIKRIDCFLPGFNAAEHS
jgi:hypothetical protein